MRQAARLYFVAVITFEDLQTRGSELLCKEAGKLRLEGKVHIVFDGDIINFRFNV